jgi:hypothetical protein
VTYPIRSTGSQISNLFEDSIQSITSKFSISAINNLKIRNRSSPRILQPHEINFQVVQFILLDFLAMSNHIIDILFTIPVFPRENVFGFSRGEVDARLAWDGGAGVECFIPFYPFFGEVGIDCFDVVVEIGYEPKSAVKVGVGK